MITKINNNNINNNNSIGYIGVHWPVLWLSFRSANIVALFPSAKKEIYLLKI